MQLDLDKGSKIGWQVAFQVALWCVVILVPNQDVE